MARKKIETDNQAPGAIVLNRLMPKARTSEEPYMNPRCVTMKLSLEPGAAEEVVELMQSRAYDETYSRQQIDLVRTKDGRFLLVACTVEENADVPGSRPKALRYVAPCPTGNVPGGKQTPMIPSWPDALALTWRSAQTGDELKLDPRSRLIADDDEIAAVRTGGAVIPGAAVALPFAQALAAIRVRKAKAGGALVTGTKAPVGRARRAMRHEDAKARARIDALLNRKPEGKP